MTTIEVKQNRLQKFNIIFALILMLALFLFMNSTLLFAQNYQEVGLNDPSYAGLSNTNYRIYQTSGNIVKFDIPEAAYVKIGIYDKFDNLVRTYIYNNLKAGTYEINFSSGNLDKGTYTCVLNSGSHQESSKIIIE
jgi:hypothetical protein